MNSGEYVIRDVGYRAAREGPPYQRCTAWRFIDEQHHSWRVYLRAEGDPCPTYHWAQPELDHDCGKWRLNVLWPTDRPKWITDPDMRFDTAEQAVAWLRFNNTDKD